MLRLLLVPGGSTRLENRPLSPGTSIKVANASACKLMLGQALTHVANQQLDFFFFLRKLFLKRDAEAG